MDFLLTGCALIDGTGQDPLPTAALHLQDGRIAWVGPQTICLQKPVELPIRMFQAEPSSPGLSTPTFTSVGMAGNPLANISNVRKMEAVYKSGEQIKIC